MTPEPPDAAARRAVAPVTCYPARAIGPRPGRHDAPRERLVERVVVPPRTARHLRVPAGCLLRVACAEGAQVGDLNLFYDRDPSERLYTGKTRALHGTHVTVGDRLWSSLPHLRPLATIVADSLAWYGTDAFGLRVHDVIGTRCDPYTARLLTGEDYDRCCHSNLVRALAEALGCTRAEAEPLVHDVLNVFMCTGFDREGRYVMKASPARAGDHLDMVAEVDLLAVLSACPGGDCGAEHSSDAAGCHPLVMEAWAPEPAVLEGWTEPPRSFYAGGHGP